MEGKKILVTGAAGFIGSNLTDYLLERGANVVGLDNMWNGRKENLQLARQNPHFTFIKGDIRDLNHLQQIMKDVDIVFHEAALTSVPQSIAMPDLCNSVNITGTLNILNAARRCDVSKVVFASSAALYGNNPILPKQETMMLEPLSPYGVSKEAGEAYLVAYHHVYGMNTTALRYFNVFGPRQIDSPYSGVIAIFLARIMKGKNPIIFGDGKQSRDFIYIKDVVRANLLAAQSKKAAGQVINIAGGKPINLNKLTQIMIETSDHKELTIKYKQKREGDILFSYADVQRAKDILEFEPEYDAISGFNEYYQYFKNKYHPFQ